MRHVATPKPQVDYTKNVVEGPVKITGPKPSDRFQTWKIVDASPEEIQNRTERMSSIVRLRRDKLLTECDWTQLQDSKADKKAWAEYRDALRKIPQQQKFPWDVAWPEKPA